MNQDEREDFIDKVAQAVIDKMEEQMRVMQLADLVVARVIALQQEKAALDAQEQAAQDSVEAVGIAC